MNYRFSQGEHWTRTVWVEAETLEEAKKRYKKYCDTGESDDDLIISGEPEFLDDIPDDLIIFDENGNVLWADKGAM